MRKTWNWLNGKKTEISSIFVLLWQGFQVFFPDVIGEKAEGWIETVIYTVLAGGVGHRGYKQLKNK
jgi:hypothetical protein